MQPGQDARGWGAGHGGVAETETSAIENGADPDRELAGIDDEDVFRPPHASTTRDTPIVGPWVWWPARPVKMVSLTKP